MLLYFKMKKSTKIKQGRSKTPRKPPITIEESPSKKEEVGPTERKAEEVNSLENISKTPIAYARRFTTILISFKKPKTLTTLQQKGKGKLQEKQSMLQEKQSVLQKEHKVLLEEQNEQ